jgi:tetraacyldisaccharide 4'-kinase
MTLRSRLQQRLVGTWQTRGLLAWLLYPFSLLTRAARAFDAWRYRVGISTPEELPVPVIVVGNLYVGGTGKTPLVLELVARLRERGYAPGIVSRGYGAAAANARLVDPNGSAADYGDEPLLLAQQAQCPVAVGRDRVAAGRLLLNLHPNCNVIVADDGLQHRRLARNVELALVHYRGLGNGWTLPAGPLRDPPSRLQTVDAVVLHGASEEVPVVRVYSPFFRMRTGLGTVYALKDPARRISLEDLAAEQAHAGTRLIAAAGIGMPDRFFAMLRATGLRFDALPLEDHHPFEQNPFAGRVFDCALITEKDAVKCRANREIAADGRICAVTLDTSLDPALIDFIVARIGPPPPTAALAR